MIDGEFGFLKVAQRYGLPKSTVQDRVNKFRSSGDLVASTSKGFGRLKRVFTPSAEQGPVDHVLEMETRLFGLAYRRRLAFECAETNNFSTKIKLAGEIGW